MKKKVLLITVISVIILVAIVTMIADPLKNSGGGTNNLEEGEDMSTLRKALALDETLKEVRDAILNVNTNNAVMYTSQNRADTDKAVARMNIGAAAMTDVSSPYNFKGSVESTANLPASNNVVNDTYYVTGAKCKYTWNGSAWYQSSLDEGDYEDELGELKEDLTQLSDKIITPNIYSEATIEANKFIGGMTQNFTPDVDNEFLQPNRFVGYINIPNSYEIKIKFPSMEMEHTVIVVYTEYVKGKYYTYSGICNGYSDDIFEYIAGNDYYTIKCNEALAKGYRKICFSSVMTDINDYYIWENKRDILIPDTIRLPIGSYQSFYVDSIALNTNKNEISEITIDGMKTYSHNEVVSFMPTENNTGTKNVKVKLNDGSVIEKQIEVICGFSGFVKTNMKFIAIGDSMTGAALWCARAVEQASAFGGTLESVGTITGQYGYKCEGRAGWSAYNYTHDVSFNEETNAFMFNGVFNFGRYMTTNGFSNIDCVVIMLGTNDLAQGHINDFVDNMNTIINSITEYNSDIKIIVAIPPTRCVAGTYTYDDKNKAMEVVSVLLNNFQYRNGIYVSPCYASVDPINDYWTNEISIDRGISNISVPIDYVHPSDNKGYPHIGDCILNTIMYISTLN